MQEQIEEGFRVFVSDGEEGIGAVREVRRAPAELVVYVENAGDFVVPLTAVKAVHSKKVVLDCGQLEPGLRKAIGRAHDAEDDDYVAPDTPTPEE